MLVDKLCDFFCSRLKTLRDSFCWTGTLLARGDEVSIVPCAYVDRILIANANLGVDDHGMMKNQKDLENS